MVMASLVGFSSSRSENIALAPTSVTEPIESLIVLQIAGFVAHSRRYLSDSGAALSGTVQRPKRLYGLGRERKSLFLVLVYGQGYFQVLEVEKD